MEYQIIRSNRRTVAIQIKSNGQIIVRCPRKMPADAVAAFVNSKTDWIKKHTAKHSAEPAVKLTDSQLRQLREQAKEFISCRVAYYAPVVGVSYNRITIRVQRTRWGSCSAKGNLNFNCLLVLAPLEVIDYVVVHELCHRKQLNHSDEFWGAVAQILPDYRQRRAWLKEHGKKLIAMML